MRKRNKKCARKNPTILNSGNIKRWVYVNAHKYKNRSFDILKKDIEVYFNLKPHLIEEKVIWNANDFYILRDYVQLYNYIQNINLSQKKKDILWKIYTISNPINFSGEFGELQNTVRNINHQLNIEFINYRWFESPIITRS